MNADIASGYFGDIRIVDISGAVTENGDRQTWRDGMQHGDNIHISQRGHEAVFNYLRDECAWLWLDSPNAFLT